MALDVRRLRLVREIARTGSISAAAQALGIAQPSLSTQLRDLEAQFGVDLFQRHARGMIPTDVGKMCLVHADRILDALEQAENDLSARNTTASSRVRLGMPFSIALQCVGGVIARLEQDWPHICLRMIEGFSGTLAERLITHQDDLAVFVGEPKDPRIETQFLGRERMCLVAPKDWDIANAAHVTLEEVCRHPMIMPGTGHGIRSLLDGHASVNGWSINVRHEFDSAYHLVTQVARGSGVTVLTPYSARFALSAENVAVIPISEPELWRQVFLGWPRDQMPDLPTTVVRGLLVDTLRDAFDNLGSEAEWLGPSR